MLEVREIDAFYGLSHALHGVSLQVGKGEVVALLGRNGVGKSTTLKAIMGIVPPRRGQVVWNGRVISGLPPFRIALLGISYVPEERRIFPDLTVRENLEVGKTRGNRGWTIERVYDLFPALKRLDGRLGGNLSGGEQQMLTIGRALMADPELILLDEPSEGLAPVIVDQMQEGLERLKHTGLSILLSEQNLEFVRGLAERGYILDKGHVVHSGPLAEIWKNEEISSRYLAV